MRDLRESNVLMEITDQIALVTGANRGIGRQFVLELLERGAGKVYATARRPETLDFDDSRVVPLRLDLVDHGSVTEAVVAASDATLLVNNAGISIGASLVTGDLSEIRRAMDTHFWGTLDVIREFAPALAANGGGPPRRSMRPCERARSGRRPPAWVRRAWADRFLRDRRSRTEARFLR